MHLFYLRCVCGAPTDLGSKQPGQHGSGAPFTVRDGGMGVYFQCWACRQEFLLPFTSVDTRPNSSRHLTTGAPYL